MLQAGHQALAVNVDMMAASNDGVRRISVNFKQAHQHYFTYDNLIRKGKMLVGLI